jgi:hypothetical protein
MSIWNITTSASDKLLRKNTHAITEEKSDMKIE